MRAALLLLCAVACGDPIGPQAPGGPQPGASVAVYLDGAIIEQRVWLDLDAGRQTVSIEGVSAQARPTSLWVRPIGDVGVRIVSAALRSPLDSAAIAARHRGRPIRVVTGAETIEGALVDLDAVTIAVRRGDRVEVVPRAAVRSVELERHGGSGASIDLEVEAARPGRQLVEVAYATGGLGWTAHYDVDVRDAGDAPTVRLRAAATIRNDSGVRFDDARVSLHAGRLAEPTAPTVWRGQAPFPVGEETVTFAGGDDEMPARFELTTGMVPQQGPYGDDLSGFGTPTYDQTRTIPVVRRLSFRNRAEGGLELPPGPVTITMRAAGGPPETVRVQLADSVAPGEAVELDLGSIDGLHVVRRQKAYLPRGAGRLERYELGVSNIRDEPVTVAIREKVPKQLGGVTLERSRPRARLTGRTVRIDLTVPAHETEIAIYEVVFERRR